uniref:Suppressor protein SRP40-like n=1 Tax=Bursaphelenchus xylophilus TaxID=6326 RepID=A0A1I7SJ82_BURXY
MNRRKKSASELSKNSEDNADRSSRFQRSSRDSQQPSSDDGSLSTFFPSYSKSSDSETHVYDDVEPLSSPKQVSPKNRSSSMSRGSESNCKQRKRRTWSTSESSVQSSHSKYNPTPCKGKKRDFYASNREKSRVFLIFWKISMAKLELLASPEKPQNHNFTPFQLYPLNEPSPFLNTTPF